MENDEIMQSILQVGGIFSKQSEEAGIKAKEGEEDEDLSSSDSDMDTVGKSPSDKQKKEASGKCCAGPTQEEKAKRK